MKNNDFTALEQALGGYLHQDFLCDYENADEAIANFVASATLAEIVSVQTELREAIQFVEHLPNPGDFLLQIGCYYDPSTDGMTVGQWLQRVQETLSSRNTPK